MSNKILNKVNNDIFSYDTTGGVFKMSRIMPTEIHHAQAGVGTNGYILTSTGPDGNGWTWTDPSTLGGTTLTAGTGVSIISDAISIGQSVATTDDVTFGKVTAKNLELNDNNGIKLTIEGDTGDVTCHGTLSIDAITKKGTTGIAIENCSINGNTISALNYKCGSRTIVDASAGCSFTALEIKPSTSGASETLLIDSNGDITCHGTLSIDTISEKSTGSGITLSSAVKMTAIQSGTNNNKLLYNSTTGEITYQTDTSSGSDLSSLTDVNMTSPSTGEILTYNGTNWVNNGSLRIHKDVEVWNEDDPITYSSGNDGDVLTSQGLGKPPKWTGGGLGGLTDVSLSPFTTTTTTPTANRSFDFRNATIDTATKKVSINGTIVGEIKQDTAGNLETTQSATNGLVGSVSEYFSFDPKWELRETAQSSVTIEIYFKVLNGDGYFNGIFAAYNSATQYNPSGLLNNFQIDRNQSYDTIQFWSATASGTSHNLRTTTASVGMQGDDFGHLVCIYDGVNGTKSVYINGVISGVEGGVNGVGFYDYVGPYTQMIIGRTPWTNDNGVEYIRFFRHYDRVLTAEEIEVLYNARDTTTTLPTEIGDGEIIAYDTSTNKWVNTNILNSISTTTFFNINSPLQLVGQTGTTGQVLSVASDGNPEWTTPSAGVSNPKVYGSIWCDADYAIYAWSIWGGENANPISSDNNSPGYEFVNSHPNMWINPDPGNEFYWRGYTGNGNVLQIPRDGHYHITMHQMISNTLRDTHTITSVMMTIGRFRAQQYWNPGWYKWINQPDIIGEYRSNSSAPDNIIHAKATATAFLRAGDRIFGQFYVVSTGGTIVGDANNPFYGDTADGYTTMRSSGFSVFSID